VNNRNLEAYLIGLRYAHHASRSGYESFARYLNIKFLWSPLPFRNLKRARRLDWELQRKLDRPCYTCALLVQELASAPHLALRRRVPHHVIYADTDLRFLGTIGHAIGAPVIATFHEPRWGLDYMRITQKVTRGLAGVILVSESQRDWFTDLMPDDRIFVVPHGIDTEFFVPAPHLADEPRIIVVGSKYRDFELLSKAADIVFDQRPEARIVAVGTHHNLNRPLDDPRFEYSSPPDDVALRAAYQRARVAVFPMMFATANNALLEAMSCGLPITATDVGGIREYVGNAGLVCAKDPEALAHALLALLADDKLARSLGTVARERAVGYDFKYAAAGHRQVYRAVAS
jgi:glycosyltransferase involved in cell wall biosynthesis